MKRKGGRNRKKKWHNGKQKPNEQMRAALETKVRSRHAKPAGGRM